MINISVISNVWSSVWPYLVAVFVFLLLIVIHEFGHFSAAKLLGVRVNEFAVGFGPKLFSKQIGETKYSLNLIPFGGYCAMEGEDEESSDSKAFCNKKPWRRFIIVAMGALFNLLLGIIIVGITLIPVKYFNTTTVAEFYDNSVSDKSGLAVGDQIYEVEGRRIFTSYDLSYSFTNVKDGRLDMTVLRDGKKVRLNDVKFDTQKEDGFTYITVDFYVDGEKNTVGTFLKQTAKTSLSYGLVIWRSFIDLLTGKYGISAVSGPVGITVVIGDVVKRSVSDLLIIMAMITINLGMFNLFPLPALDGGRLLFILIEMICKKPVPQKYEALVHTAGFIILIGFLTLVTAKDIWSLIAG